MNTLEDTGIQERTSLPGGWETVPLLELGDLIRGVTYKKQDASTEPFTDSIPILRANNIQNGNLDQEELVHIPQNLVLDIQLITKGDILIATSSGSISVVGKAARAQNDTNTAFGAFCGLIRPRPEISSRYLGHYFGSQDYRQKASAMARGVNINNLKKTHFESLSVNLPPLNEQRRIADKLDTTLAAVEACKQKLNNAAETIRRFRQSVLAAAVSGELTREWREERGIEGEWEDVLLSDIADIQGGITKDSKKQLEEYPEHPYLRVANVQRGFLALDTVTYIRAEPKKADKLILRRNDILFNEGGDRDKVGRGWIWEEQIENCIFQNHIFRARLYNENNQAKFISHWANTKGSTHFLQKGKQTTNLASISKKTLGQLPIRLPTADEQKEIVERIDILLSKADLLEERNNSAMQCINSLIPSILGKAFRGELVPQDPNDEPASVLLERIKDQREAEEAAKKPAKRGRKRKADAAQIVIPEDIADNHLAKLLEECGALSERALLAASELEPAVFQLQLSKELKAGGLKQVDIDGEAAYADAAWEEEK